jgi:hypothetical protein
MLALSAALFVCWLGAPPDLPAPTEPESESEPEPESEPRPKVEFAPGRGLAVTSADGRFGLRVGMFAQVLYTLSRTPTATPALAQGLELRRARLQLRGHLFGPHNKFYAHLGFSPRDMQFSDGHPTKTPIFDWWMEFDHLRDATFRVGQFRVPFSRERRAPVTDIAFVDRSLANFEFNLDRDIGLDIRSDDLAGLGLLRYDVGVFIGEGRDSYQFGDFGLLYVGRLEVLPLGLFDDYQQSDLDRRSTPKLAIGAAYAFLDQAKANRGILGDVPTDGGTTDTHNVTGDLVFKLAGLSLIGEVFYRHGIRHYGDATIIDANGLPTPAPRERPRDGLGWSAQFGYVLPWIPLELLGRYSGVTPIGTTSLIRQEELGGGLQWFIVDHAIELVLDYFRTYADAQITTGSDRLRLQLQMAF